MEIPTRARHREAFDRLVATLRHATVHGIDRSAQSAWAMEELTKQPSQFIAYGDARAALLSLAQAEDQIDGEYVLRQADVEGLLTSLTIGVPHWLVEA